jgi:hypothetical protein
LLRSRLLAAISVGAAVWLTAGQAWPGKVRVHGLPPAIAFPPPASASHPAFRLGTAAGPLGWSTAVGDFNTDGTPDVAVADRLVHPVAGASYLLEFSVSGHETKTIAFDTAQNALTVHVSDVDHDHDLDIVVSAPLSREVVGVWLNDGQGGFSASDARPFAYAIANTQSADATGAAGSGSIAVLTSRGEAGYPPARGWSASAPRPSPVAIRPVQFRVTLFSSAVPSRAPPLTPLALS